MNNDREHIVKRYEDNPAFGSLESHLRLMDPDYSDCIVLGVADKLKLGKEEVEPPAGCLFVTLRTRENKRLLLTVPDSMFNPEDAPQSEYRVTNADLDNVIANSRVAYSIGSSGKTVICEITLPSGFVCVGTSNVVDPQNFKFPLGAQAALVRAREEVARIIAERVQRDLFAYRAGQGIRTA